MQADFQKPSGGTSKLFSNEIQIEAKRLRHLTVYAWHKHNHPPLDLGPEIDFCQHIFTETTCKLSAAEQSPARGSQSTVWSSTTEGLCSCPHWQPSRILYSCIIDQSRWRLRTQECTASIWQVQRHVLHDLERNREMGTSWMSCLPATNYSRR